MWLGVSFAWALRLTDGVQEIQECQTVEGVALRTNRQKSLDRDLKKFFHRARAKLYHWSY
jgi:hypothetical protein